MNKRTKFFIFTLACAAVVGASGLLTNNFVNEIHGVNAEDCTHTHVEHYRGLTPRKGNAGYVDHYACCDCHTAWADEARTTIIGQTYTNRTNLDLASNYTYSTNWDAGNDVANSVPYYNETYGVVFQSSMNTKDGSYHCLESNFPAMDTTLYSGCTFSVYNDTDGEFKIVVYNRNWGANGVYVSTVPANTWHTVNISVDFYNNYPSGSEYGWTLILGEGTPVSGNVLVTLPQFIAKPTTDKINQALAGYKSLEDDPTGLAYISTVDAVTEYVSANGDSTDGIDNVELFNKLKSVKYAFNAKTEKLVGWGYGDGSITNIETVEDGIHYTKVSVGADVGNELGVRTNQMSGLKLEAGVYVARIFNPTESEVHCWVHADWDNWALQKVVMAPNSWTTFQIDGTKLPTDGIITPVFTAVDGIHNVAGDWMFSSFVSYNA